jgi:hypothetical protein
MHQRLPIGVALWLLAACSSPSVGAPCLPELVPEDGFDEHEAYIEASSLQCETRVCLVYRLGGDPREGCMATDTKRCALHDDIESSVYCTCRCDGAGSGDACQCPEGYACTEVLDQGDPGVRGSYCVRRETVSD